MPEMTVRAKEHHDWSDPSLITWAVRESNFCTPGSYVSAALSPREGGGTRIHVVWNRTPTSFAARLATVLIRATKGRPVAASIRKAMAKLEAAPD